MQYFYEKIAMKLNPINLENKLREIRGKQYTEEQTLASVYELLAIDGLKEEQIHHKLQSSNEVFQNNFDLDLLETDRIFHINTIEKICIDYRLRFLDSKYFKPEIPYEAISEIKHLEKTHNTNLNGFKIIAPAKLLKLKNADDPLLFAPISNGYYYLIHKWGNDINPLRKWLMMPFRTFEHLVISMLVLSGILTFLVPHGNFQVDTSTFLILFLFMFKSVIGVAIFCGISRGFNVSAGNWNSKFYNG